MPNEPEADFGRLSGGELDELSGAEALAGAEDGSAFFFLEEEKMAITSQRGGVGSEVGRERGSVSLELFCW